MHVQHGHSTGRRRIRSAALGGALTLSLLPLLGVAQAHAATGQISQFTMAQGSPNMAPMTLGADGDLYFGAGGAIDKISPSGQITQIADPGGAGNIYLTAKGPDGNVWFASSGTVGGLPGDKLGRVTPSGQVTDFTIPAFNGLRIVAPQGLAAGSDGSLWFTANAAATLRGVNGSLYAKVNPATGAVTEFPIPTTTFPALPGAITTGSDGNLWFAEENLPGIARVTPATGQITQFTMAQGAPSPAPMTLGADGDLYFSAGAAIDKITPSGQITQIADPGGAGNIYLTAKGPDGNVWFADSGMPGGLPTDKLGRVTPAGQVTDFAIPAFNGLRIVAPQGLAAGSDGSLWFTADAAATLRGFRASLVGQVNPATGAVTEFPIPTTSFPALPGAITTGSDGNLWFPEENLPGIARLTTS